MCGSAPMGSATGTSNGRIRIEQAGPMDLEYPPCAPSTKLMRLPCALKPLRINTSREGPLAAMGNTARMSAATFKFNCAGNCARSICVWQSSEPAAPFLACRIPSKMAAALLLPKIKLNNSMPLRPMFLKAAAKTPRMVAKDEIFPSWRNCSLSIR